jgi:hypothetical protein
MVDALFSDQIQNGFAFVRPQVTMQNQNGRWVSAF